MDFRRRIVESGDELRRIHKQVHAMARQRGRSKAHAQARKEAADEFRRAYDKLAFPGGLERQIQLLDQKNPLAVERAVQYLEVDPVFFRSGYTKEKFLRRLKQIELEDHQQDRLRRVILRKVREGGGREFRAYCRLARRLACGSFVAELEMYLNDPDGDVRKRASWVADVMGS